MKIVFEYRATSFGKPVAPWRTDKRQVCRDLIANDLGGYDEWGQFFIKVPGDVEKRESKVAVQSPIYIREARQITRPTTSNPSPDPIRISR